MPRVLTFVAQFVWALVVILLMQVVLAIVSGYYVTSESAIAIFLKNHNFITEDTADWMEEKMQVYDVHSAVDFLAVSTSCRRPPHVSSFFVVAEELLIGNCPGAIGALVVRLSLADDRSLVGACSLPSRSVHNDSSSIALHHF